MHGRTAIKWMAASFSVALAIACIALGGAASGDKIGVALRATARWSFVLFSLASCGGALAALFGSRFETLARHARDFGLAFASAHLVHLTLVAVLYYRAQHEPVPRESLIFFSIAAVLTYVLAVSSLDRLSGALQPRTWRIVRRFGVEYIALAFLVDFAKNPLQSGPGYFIAYLPFQIAAIAGPLLRLAAAVRRHSQGRTANDAAKSVVRRGMRVSTDTSD